MENNEANEEIIEVKIKADEAKEEAQNLEKEISSGKITNGQLAVEND